MAEACLSAKQAEKMKKTLLPHEKVYAIIDHVRKIFPNAEVGAIRIKISTKLRDERNAFKQNTEACPSDI